MRPVEALRSAARYLKENPTAVIKAAKDATQLRFGVPLEALQWVAQQGKQKKGAPTEIELAPVPPALRFSAKVDAMGTPLRVAASIRIDDVFIGPDTIRVGVRLHDVALSLLAESSSPVAMLIKSGVLDLTKVGNVVKVLPKRHPAIVDAADDRIVLDLFKVPALERSSGFRRALAVLSPVLGIRAIETDGENLYVSLRATPSGLPEAINAVLNR